MSRRVTLTLFCFAALATLAAYHPGLRGPFIFDDLTNILLAKQLQITDLSFQSLKEAAFYQVSSSFGRPIAMLTFALNYYFSGFDSLGFKLTNIVIHILNGLLFYGIGLRLLTRYYEREGTQPVDAIRRARLVSIAISSVWLIHPVNLTSVLYVVQRMTSLSTLFVLLGLLGYTIGREKASHRVGLGLLLMAASIGFFTPLAVLSKENGVLLPLFAFLIELTFFRFREAGQREVSTIKWFWVGVLLLISAALVAVLLINPSRLLGLFSYQFRNFTLMERLLTESRALWFYLKLILLPDIREMGVYHDDFMLSTSLFSPSSTSLALLALLAAIGVAVLAFRRHPLLSFGVLWFLLGHSIESTALPLELVHEHRNYLPQYGILLAGGFYLEKVSLIGRSVKGVWILAIVYLTLLGAATYSRASDWKDEWTLYTRDVANHPRSPRAHTILAIILHDNRQYTVAQAHFEEAARLDPTDSTAMIRLVQHLYVANRKAPESALKELETRLRKYPYSNITLWTFEPLLTTTQPDRELNLRLIRMYEQLLSRRDINVGSDWLEVGYRTLGFAYRERRQYEKALYFFQKAATLTPRPQYRLLCAEMYKKTGDMAGARDMIERARPDKSQLNDDEAARFLALDQELNRNSDRRIGKK